MEEKKCPTLLIGLGGTGASVTEMIKKQLDSLKPEERIRFLAIDTKQETSENRDAMKEE